MSNQLQITNALVVTPSDTISLAMPTRSIYIGGAGNLSVLMAGGQTTLFSALPVGTILPVSCLRINATNTTATLIVAMW